MNVAWFVYLPLEHFVPISKLMIYRRVAHRENAIFALVCVRKRYFQYRAIFIKIYNASISRRYCNIARYCIQYRAILRRSFKINITLKIAQITRNIARYCSISLQYRAIFMNIARYCANEYRAILFLKIYNANIAL